MYVYKSVKFQTKIYFCNLEICESKISVYFALYFLMYAYKTTCIVTCFSTTKNEFDIKSSKLYVCLIGSVDTLMHQRVSMLDNHHHFDIFMSNSFKAVWDTVLSMVHTVFCNASKVAMFAQR